ncbi:hypothetical protein H7F15_14835 [Pontibacter sp. Tf4]|uniref:hypothetical protein n=1 Tax=Pontibacter sp. Tf4 TaxID=2761620 RepID=UPI00162A180D|nr:hypothetical protein [Pontibacter sp. Tf4]MBB6612324.1 hypothetical protein [Pontibacter sp. Tf4]
MIEENTEVAAGENVPSVPEEKYYNLNPIMVATVLGGPIAAGYMMYRNYTTTGEEEGAKSIIIWAIIYTYLLFGVMMLLPEPVIDRIPNIVIPWINGGIAYFVAKKYQNNILLEHEQQNGAFYSVWRSVWMGIVCAVVTVIMIIPLLFFMSPVL